jgi:hypothetical protein
MEWVEARAEVEVGVVEAAAAAADEEHGPVQPLLSGGRSHGAICLYKKKKFML